MTCSCHGCCRVQLGFAVAGERLKVSAAILPHHGDEECGGWLCRSNQQSDKETTMERSSLQEQKEGGKLEEPFSVVLKFNCMTSVSIFQFFNFSIFQFFFLLFSLIFFLLIFLLFMEFTITLNEGESLEGKTVFLREGGISVTEEKPPEFEMEDPTTISFLTVSPRKAVSNHMLKVRGKLHFISSHYLTRVCAAGHRTIWGSGHCGTN